jgi:hypothetical protein
VNPSPWDSNEKEKANYSDGASVTNEKGNDCISNEASGTIEATGTLGTELVEQPVWDMDCYTRRNIVLCLEFEFDAETATTFVEKWLLPTMNACPAELAHDISNAVGLLEGLSLHQQADNGDEESHADEDPQQQKSAVQEWSHTILGNALVKKIKTAAPPYVIVAANVLRRARQVLGPDFFRVHPKGHGSVLLSEKAEPNTLITFYRGKVYPPWRWCEKMDAIEITEQRKHLKAALQDAKFVWPPLMGNCAFP